MLDKTTLQTLRAFADGYIACAQTHEGIDDEWEDYGKFCLNFYDNEEKLIVAVYPIVEYQQDGKTLRTEDMSKCLCENLLEAV